MAKWKCDICNSEFDNYHAEGFNNKIYCPLCYYKHEYIDLKQQLSQLQQENESLNAKLYKFEYYEEANDVLLKENKKLQQRNHDLLIAKTEKMDIIMNQSSAIEKLKQERKELINKYQTYIKNILDNMQIVKDMTEQNFQIYEKDIIRVWNKFNCYQEFIKDLSKLKGSDPDVS